MAVNARVQRKMKMDGQYAQGGLSNGYPNRSRLS